MGRSQVTSKYFIFTLVLGAIFASIIWMILGLFELNSETRLILASQSPVFGLLLLWAIAIILDSRAK